jgi:hypothetical protein
MLNPSQILNNFVRFGHGFSHHTGGFVAQTFSPALFLAPAAKSGAYLPASKVGATYQAIFSSTDKL